MNEAFVQKYDAYIQRIFEIIPGLSIWILLLSPLFGGIAGYSIAQLFINALIVLSVYWFYRAIMITVGVVIGYFKYKADIKKDWIHECLSLNRENLPEPESLPKEGLLPKQLIVIANYGEDYPIIQRTMNALMQQNYPKELLYVAISIEERKAKRDPEYAKRGEYLRRDFGEFFGDRLMFFVHPDGIPGEVIGAAANRTWGAKNTVAEIEKRGMDINEFMITAPDGDIVFHKEYFAAMTYRWLVSEERNKKFYQTALYTFNNNYWDVPALVRILSISLTLPVLASSIFEKRKRETFSCYSLNLGVMKAVNYWDTSLGIDDTTFYWRPYFYFHGHWTCEVFFIPLSADAIYEKSYIKNHYAQYKQYVRWGWGVISVPIAVKVLLSDSKISLFEKISKMYHLFEVFVLWKVTAFLLAFGIPIILFLNTELNKLVIAYTVPQTISTILSFATIFLIPSTIFKILLIPPKPKNMSVFKFIIILILEAPLNILSMFTFSFIPFIESSTRMMIGQKHAKVITWSEKQIVQ